MNAKSNFTPQLENARGRGAVTYILGAENKASNRSRELSAPQKHQTPANRIDAVSQSSGDLLCGIRTAVRGQEIRTPSLSWRLLSLHNLPTTSRPINASRVLTNRFQDTSFYLSPPLLCLPKLCEHILRGIDPAGRSENGKDEDESTSRIRPDTQ